MQCNLCRNEVSRLSAKKIADGFLCKQCIQRLPKSIMGNIGSYCIENLETIDNYMKNIRKDLFFPTASFGTLHIDEIHGFFAIEDHLNDDGYDELTDIFYCLSLKEVGITPTNVTVDRSNNVTCDFELHCWFEYPECSFTVPIKKKVKCPSKRVNKTELSYEMPGDYYIFIKMFDHMVSVARRKYEDSMKEHFISYPAFIKMKAQSLFMLGEGYDAEEVFCQYKKLMDAFADDDGRIAIIEQAYHILMDGIRKEEGDGK